MKIAAIALAAGMSRRMGAFKPLLPVAGKGMVVHVLETLGAVAEIVPVLVVTGHEAGRLCAALEKWPVTFVHNADFAAGEMLSSVQAGVRALPDDVGAFVLAFADQPMVRAETVRALIRAWVGSKASMVIPVFEGKRGHPVLISMALRGEILGLPAGESLKTVTRRHLDLAGQIVVEDGGVLGDLDTWEEYERVRGERA